jgi:hypothetical protein
MQPGFETLAQVEVVSRENQRFSFVLQPGPLQVCSLCVGDGTGPMSEPEMSKLPDLLVLPQSPVVPQLKATNLQRNPIARLLSALRF